MAIQLQTNAAEISPQDSLQHLIQTSRNDSTRNALYLELARLYKTSDTTRMKFYLEKMVNTAAVDNYYEALGLSMNELGRMRTYYGKYKDAETSYDLAMRAFNRARNSDAFYNTYINKGNNYLFQSDFDLALKIYLESYDYYQKREDKKGKNRCLNNMGIIYKNHGEYDKAIECYEKSLENVIPTPDSVSYAETYINLGNVHVLMGSYDKAIQYYNHALTINERNGVLLEVGKCLSNIGVIHNKCGQYEKAETYLKKAFEISTNTFNKGQQAICLINLGTNYSEMGKFETALEYLKRGTELKEELGDIKGLSNCYIYQAEIFVRMKRYGEAAELVMQALDLKKGLQDREGVTRGLLLLSEINLETGQTRLAGRYGQAGLDSALMIGSLEHIARAYELLEKSAFQAGNYKQAYLYLEEFKTFNDSLLNFKNSETVSELEYRYHANVLEKENENLKIQEDLHKDRIKEQQILIIGGIILILLIISLLIIVAYYNRRKKVANQQLEKKNLTITMQNVKLDKLNRTKDKLLSIMAHDLRGTMGNQVTALNLLSEMEHENDRPTRSKLIANLGHSASASLELLENLLVWSKMQEGEIEFFPESTNVEYLIKNTLALLEQTAKNKDIRIRDLTSGEVVCFVDSQMISSILRNLTMNAIKFSERNSEVTLRSSMKDRNLIIEVADRGVGLSEESIRKILEGNGGWSKKGTENEKGSGLGLSMVNEFIKLHGGHLQVESREGSGSLFRIIIPCDNNRA